MLGSSCANINNSGMNSKFCKYIGTNMKITKEELLKCSSGEMFGIGNPQLPMPPMLMFDRICEISKDSGTNKMGHVVAELILVQICGFLTVILLVTQ